MKTNENRRLGFKSSLIFNLLLFSSLCSRAGFADKAKNAISKEFNSFEGIWIIAGLLGGGLGFYFLMSFINKRNDAKQAAHDAANPHNPNLHHRRRPKRVIRR